ncbi:tRNA dihydrouridine(20/20a) synthase DusA [Immundisolibacter sp.]|uniref:tRNA dihydrouridine(20/20a) synthase DusA n=1 Tax=Immundisolibacter sp. TaxID=1934948 RepID=UPI0035687F1C
MNTPSPAPLSRRLSVAPMMDCTDRHARYLHRLLSRCTLLYTEMVTAQALLRGDPDYLLAYNPAEHPVALQLGGSDPAQLAQAARIGVDFGYDEINLNVGCPSDRVQSGRFGACLMAEPALVGECVAAMQAAVAVPVTVKCRIGIDRTDRDQDLFDFVESVAAAGCRHFTVHARKAWLDGLSPRENREIPPLRYETVYRLKRLRPELEIVINGGITDLDQALAHLRHVDGVMIGRAAYHSPWLLADVDRRLFGAATPPPERAQVLAQYIGYMDHQLGAGTPITALTRPLLGLFQGQPGARAWRRTLSTPDTARDLGRVWAAAQHVLEPGQLAGTCAA